MPTGRADVVAEVAHVGGAVLVGRPTADAPLRIGRVLEFGAAVPRVVEPEDDGSRPLVRQLAHLGIVPVHDECGLVRELSYRLAPARGDQLKLPVPVELVAKEIAEAHD